MALTWLEITGHANAFAEDWKDAHSEKREALAFYTTGLGVFGLRRKQAARDEQSVKLLSSKRGLIDLFSPGTPLTKQKTAGKPLVTAKGQAPDFFAAALRLRHWKALIAVANVTLLSSVPSGLMAANPPLTPFVSVRGSDTPPAAESAAERSKPRIALTFDDLPAHGPLPIGQNRLAIADAIIAALAADHAPAFGFMNGGFGLGDPSAARVPAAWRAAGLPIGNHTFSHFNLDTVGATVFLADAERNVRVVAASGGTRDERWFRYPFLVEGRDPVARERVRAGLRRAGYRVAAVTMSFGDFAWNDAYARCVARHDDVAIAGLETSYLSAARTQAQRSRDLAHAALGREIPYVLLMHLGAFDARMLQRLLALYTTMGFTFTTLKAAEADPFYEAARDLALPGPSPTLEAAARAKGVTIPANAPLPAASICA